MEDLTSQATASPAADEAGGVRNRRSGERHITLFRVGALVVDGQRQLCVVKNISARGALMRPYCKLAEGQQVTLEFKEQQPIEAEVIWAKDSEAGIAFKQPIEVLDLLKGSDGPRPRMPRVEVHASGFVRQGALLHRILVTNISQGGISAQCAAELQVGGDVTVTLAGLAPLPAVVCWARSGAYGIKFNAVLGLPLLIEWLQAQSETGVGRS